MVKCQRNKLKLKYFIINDCILRNKDERVILIILDNPLNLLFQRLMYGYLLHVIVIQL